jgi:hypothetical protein
MTQENTEKPEKSAAKSPELKARIKLAATVKFIGNLTDAELAKEIGVSVYTIADWKRRPEWSEAVKAIADKQMGETYSEMLAMASYAREVIQDLMRKDTPPALRLQAAQAVLRMGITGRF